MVDRIERTTAMIALGPGQEAGIRSALASMGATLPEMGRFTEADGLLLARTAPFQILAMREGAEAPLMAELAPLGANTGLIDLSDARIAVRLSGPNARDQLAQLVPLDLHHSKFQPGSCAQTIMAHMSVLLLQLGPELYEVQCARSYEASFLRAFELTPEATV